MRIRRRDILNRLVDHHGYSSYLEVGVAGGATYKHVRIRSKTGVDPRWRLWNAFRPSIKKTTSDRFFARCNRDFDLVLIDGLHHSVQAYRDIRNAIRHLAMGGSILVHDCLPSSEEQQRVPRSVVSWTGDVWRAFLKISQDETVSTLIFDTDKGCGLIRAKESQAPDSPQHRPPADVDPLDPYQVPWEKFDVLKREWLEIVPREDVFKTIDALPSREPTRP